MNYQFRTPCNPEANGRKPKFDEAQYPVFFPTEDGGKVTVLLGRRGLISLCAVILKLMEDYPDVRDEAIAAQVDTRDVT